MQAAEDTHKLVQETMETTEIFENESEAEKLKKAENEEKIKLEKELAKKSRQELIEMNMAMVWQITKLKEHFMKEIAVLEEAKTEVEQEKMKIEQEYAASLIQDDNVIHKRLEERMESIRVLESEMEKLKTHCQLM